MLGFYSFEKKHLIEKSLLEISCTITINLILKVCYLYHPSTIFLNLFQRNALKFSTYNIQISTAVFQVAATALDLSDIKNLKYSIIQCIYLILIQTLEYFQLKPTLREKKYKISISIFR